jgi:hypothetical protein
MPDHLSLRLPSDAAENGPEARSRSGFPAVTIAEDGPSRSLRRTAAAIQGLSPGYFPFVMATSIISTGRFCWDRRGCPGRCSSSLRPVSSC